MNKKPQRSWGDLQLAIAATALAVTLALWNLFATPQKQQVLAQSQDTTVPPDPTETPAPALTPMQGLSFLPVKIIFSGAVPTLASTPTTAVVAGQPQVQPPVKHRSSGGGKPPVTSGSSKP